MKTKTGTNSIQFITYLRGMACFIIVLHHLFTSFYSGGTDLSSIWSFFPELAIDDSHLIQPYVSYFLSTFNFSGAAFGVALFFLITGFTTMMSLDSDNSPLFLLKRTLRIYPTYVFGFSFTVSSIWLFCYIRGVDFPYSAKDYFCNLSLFRNWLWTPYIDNGVWTLEMNIDFYIFIFLVFFVIRRKNYKIIKNSATILSILQIVLYFVAQNYLEVGTVWWCKINIITSICPYLIFQLLGSTVYIHYKGEITAPVLCKSIGLLIIEFLTVSYFSFLSINTPSYIYGLLVFLLFYVSKDNVKPNKLISFISSISYPLYIIHAMFGYILLTILYQHNINVYVSITLVIAIVITLAYLIHITVENYSKFLCGKMISHFRNGKG